MRRGFVSTESVARTVCDTAWRPGSFKPEVGTSVEPSLVFQVDASLFPLIHLRPANIRESYSLDWEVRTNIPIFLEYGFGVSDWVGENSL